MPKIKVGSPWVFKIFFNWKKINKKLAKMIYLKISTNLRKYLLRKYQQICIISHTCSIECKYLETIEIPL